MLALPLRSWLSVVVYLFMIVQPRDLASASLTHCRLRMINRSHAMTVVKKKKKPIVKVSLDDGHLSRRLVSKDLLPISLTCTSKGTGRMPNFR